MTELQDAARVKDLRSPAGLDNLLYSADTYFSCFADLALTSPVEYFKEGQGSLMQCVITPAAPYMPWTNEAIAAETDKQVWRDWFIFGCLVVLGGVLCETIAGHERFLALEPSLSIQPVLMPNAAFPPLPCC